MSAQPGPGQSANVLERRRAEVRPLLLFVDDERAMREFASVALAERGYEVITAEDGLDALRLLTDTLPDVVISDLRMPRMSGFELLEIVRERFPLVPVIAVSGEFEGNEFPSGVHADAFLSKAAFSVAALCGKIAELLSAQPIRQRHGTPGEPVIA